jgi:hypothetical protein
VAVKTLGDERIVGRADDRLLFDAGHWVRKEFRSEAKGSASPEA